MRVAHIITRLIVGGAQENTVTTVLGLRDRHKMDCDLISGPTTGPEGSLEPLFANRPGILTVIPELIRPVCPWSDFWALRNITRRLLDRKPDIVHTHSGKAGVLGRLAAHLANVPVIIHTIHGPSFGSFQGAAANFAFTAAERIAARCTDQFVTVADAMRDQYLAVGIGRPEQYTRVFSGFDLAPFLAAQNDPALCAQLGIAPSDFVVGKIARLFELKGHDDLFAAAPELVRRCPRLKFLLVGDGPWRSRFEQKARDLGLEKHFIFIGLVPPVDVPRYLGVMDVLAHLSRREGLARVLPQALAAGKPIVAFDCDGAREVCLDGETGFLLQPGDRSGLCRALEKLSGDADLRQRLGQRGREFVKERFSAERMVDDLAELYQSRLQKTARN
ncbi:MAG: glycosyltransferase family 1 protein [Pedosphaera sp.]|nr:glycosyltransferase family 1 protein [Pedosphaera sp.]